MESFPAGRVWTISQFISISKITLALTVNMIFCCWSWIFVKAFNSYYFIIPFQCDFFFSNDVGHYGGCNWELLIFIQTIPKINKYVILSTRFFCFFWFTQPNALIALNGYEVRYICQPSPTYHKHKICFDWHINKY